MKAINKENERKLRYMGFCPKCNNITSHRFYGAFINKSKYKCMRCKNINTESNL